MTKEQQGVVLFLSLSFALFFILTSSSSTLNEAPIPRLEFAAASADREVMVEVDGAVQRRGIYALRAGMTIRELIERGGGTRRPLEWAEETLSSKLENSARVVIGVGGDGRGRVGIEPLAPKTKKVLSVAIDVNTASLEDLDTLPGIGPQTAQEIIAHRDRQGPFQTPEDLLQVRGIGPKKLAAIRSHITVQKE